MSRDLGLATTTGVLSAFSGQGTLQRIEQPPQSRNIWPQMSTLLRIREAALEELVNQSPKARAGGRGGGEETL